MLSLVLQRVALDSRSETCQWQFVCRHMPCAMMADCWKYVYNVTLLLALLVIFVQLTFGSGEVLNIE